MCECSYEFNQSVNLTFPKHYHWVSYNNNIEQKYFKLSFDLYIMAKIKATGTLVT